MLTYLTVRFFIRNRRRTLRAVIMLSIGISLVISTDMLMSGFILQIQEFASLLEDTGNIVNLNPDDGSYTNEEIEALISDLEQNGFGDTLQMGSEVKELTFRNSTITIQMTRTNMDKLVEWKWINYDVLNQNNTFYFNSDSGFTNISADYETEYLQVGNLSYYQPINQMTSDIIIDLKFKLDEPIIDIDQIYIRLPPGGSLESLQEISDKHNSKLIVGLASTTFLEITAEQITRVLIILQLAMSFLLILSITYVMLTLVYDSKDDLRIFHMLGLSKSHIFMIFLGQSILASIVAIFVSLIFSILFLQSVLPLMTFWLPYGIIVINPEFILITAFQAIFVGIASGLYPAKIGADYYG